MTRYDTAITDGGHIPMQSYYKFLPGNTFSLGFQYICMVNLRVH